MQEQNFYLEKKMKSLRGQESRGEEETEAPMRRRIGVPG